jgi:hypothetical protein
MLWGGGIATTIAKMIAAMIKKIGLYPGLLCQMLDGEALSVMDV